MDKILNASYGAQEQRDVNRRVIDRHESARIEAEYKARKGGQKDIAPSPGRQNAPPMWNAKEQGQPYGGHAAPNRIAKVEIRPGVFHEVPVPSKGGPGQARGRPSSAPINRPGPGIPGGAKPYQIDTLSLAPVLAKVEEKMRAELKRRAALHLPEKVVLLRAFGKVLGKRHSDIEVSDKVTPAQFAAAWQLLNIPVPEQLVFGLFNKYGQDSSGRLAVLNFVEAINYGAPRQIMLENNQVQKGAYVVGQKATHNGKIKYPQCKKGIWPPSNWDGSLVERSACLPDVTLDLEFIYGYDGRQATAPNIFYTHTGEVVYNAAAVGVVYNKASHTQRFFRGHDDDILSLCIHPDRSIVATGQFGKDPAAIVWETSTCTQLVKLHQGYGNRGITALCFSPDGSKLVCVCTDNNHTLYLWDWRKKQMLMERQTAPGVPPSTYGVVWSPYENDRLVAYGLNFIKFYKLTAGSQGGVEAKSSAGIFSGIKTTTLFSALFLPSGILLTGSQSGSIISWKGNQLLKEHPAHATGPMMTRRDGTRAHGGVRCLLLQNPNILLSGGSDGYVLKWDVSRGNLQGGPLQRIPLVIPELMGSVQPSPLRGLDAYPGSEVLIAGTSTCDVWEVDDSPEVLIEGQSGAVNGVAMNPAYPHVFATICVSDEVVVYSGATHKPIRVLQIAGKGDAAQSGAFSIDGQHLAVGMQSGGMKVMEFHPTVRQVAWTKDSRESIAELKYSPCGRYLAAGSHDQMIYIYDVRAGYKLLNIIKGHSSTITHIDWSSDSTVLQSNDQAYEILYSDPRTGKQVKENQRDTKWATWTCVLGFDVMGIWPPGSDGTDVNACDRSPSKRYLVTADDLGMIKLFNYPVVVHQAPFLEYNGHCSHVPNVRWAADESMVVSVGGQDRTTFQWRVKKASAKAPASGQQHGQGQAVYQQLDKAGKVWGDPNKIAARKEAEQQQRYVAERMAAAAPHGYVADRPPSGARAHRPASAQKAPVRR